MAMDSYDYMPGLSMMIYAPWVPAPVLPRFGFYTILLMVLRLRPGGRVVAGPPCVSFVWINRATSLRSRARIFGDTAKAYIKAANAIL